MTEERDLFGPVPAGFATPRVRGRGPKGGKHYVTPRGYVMPPGTGPAGETCGSCKWALRCGRFAKCRHPWRTGKNTNGPATDIRLRSPACSKWESAGEQHE